MVDLEQFRDEVVRLRDMAERDERFGTANEIDRLLSIIDNAWADGVHTCGTHCQRPMCVLRRENVALRERLAQQPAAVPDEAARLLAICQDAHDRLLRGDDDSELLAILEQAWNARKAVEAQ